jgi:hypothetical protein
MDMRNAPNLKIENARVDGPSNSNYGFFVFQWRGTKIRCQASCGGGWDHVSVSCATRCPTWEEMAWVKEKFFCDNEAVMQLHVPKSEHINNHPYCLHLWRPQSDGEIAAEAEQWARDGEAWPDDYPKSSPGSIPLPPGAFVGLKDLELADVK